MPTGVSNFVAIAAGSQHFLALVGNGAPAITVHPVSRTVSYGNAVKLTALAVGVQPLTYQWQLNGKAISGATNYALAINAVQVRDAGLYTLIVSNSLGSVTSRTAALAGC